LYYYEYFHEGVNCLDNKVLGYNFIKSRVKLYFYSGTKKINGNFEFVKS